MNPDQLYAIIAVSILAALIVFQIALILGAPIGKFAWGGQHRILPPKLRAASVSSIALYIIFAWFALAGAGFIEGVQDLPIVTIGLWVLFGYFVLGIAMNAISRSKYERLLMTPVAALLAALYFLLAL